MMKERKYVVENNRCVRDDRRSVDVVYEKEKMKIDDGCKEEK